jgi:hypothetical protein
VSGRRSLGRAGGNAAGWLVFGVAAAARAGSAAWPERPVKRAPLRPLGQAGVAKGLPEQVERGRQGVNLIRRAGTPKLLPLLDDRLHRGGEGSDIIAAATEQVISPDGAEAVGIRGFRNEAADRANDGRHV